MDETPNCAFCNQLKDIINRCTVCSKNICTVCMKTNSHNLCHTLCTECGQEITCMKNKLCKDCDRHPFDMDVENNGKNITLEQAFDSILTRNFEEYTKPEDKKTLKKNKK